MSDFGKLLRSFRKRCIDPENSEDKLTQEKLGELLGWKLNNDGYSGAAVSDWERGISKIRVDQREVLLSILEIFVQWSGVKTAREANQLLEAGNYRALNTKEAEEIFSEIPKDFNSEGYISKQKNSKSFISFLLTGLFYISEEELQELITKAEEGPSPAWPRLMVAVFRKFSDRLSVSNVLTFILWVWVWLLSWVLIVPSLRWPFSSQNEAFYAVVIYAGGAIVIPVLIGALTNTTNNEFWRKQSVSDLNLRLYTHQGASIGFHVGYFFIFMLGLLGYNLGLKSVPWIELLAVAFPVILAYASARLIPYNLFLAYKNLSLRNGAIFFIFFLFGPAWGYFLLNSYDVLLTKALGIITVLMALTILLAMMAFRYRQSGTTVIPVSWWVIFFGSLALCQFLALFIR